MKYFLTFLVFVLLLIPASNTTAKMYPDSFRDITKPDGDDHPWGGEEITPTNPDKSGDSSFDLIFTGIPSLDIFINSYLGYNNSRIKNFTPVTRRVDSDNINHTRIINQSNQSDIIEGNH